MQAAWHGCLTERFQSRKSTRGFPVAVQRKRRSREAVPGLRAAGRRSGALPVVATLAATRPLRSAGFDTSCCRGQDPSHRNPTHAPTADQAHFLWERPWPRRGGCGPRASIKAAVGVRRPLPQNPSSGRKPGSRRLSRSQNHSCRTATPGEKKPCTMAGPLSSADRPTARSDRAAYFTRFLYSPVRVSISILSPISQNSGTDTSKPVLILAGLSTLPEVSPLTPGSV